MTNDFRMMKLTPMILAGSMFLTACSRHDAEFTQEIPGTWRQVLRTHTDTLTIVPDGSFAFSRSTANDDTTFTNTGTWLIRGGGIVLTATNRIGPRALRLGDIFEAKIIHLDEHLWVFGMDNGTTNCFRR